LILKQLLYPLLGIYGLCRGMVAWWHGVSGMGSE